MKCENCRDGENLAEETTCWHCGREGLLVKENTRLRKEIDELLLTRFSTISDEYLDIKEKINLLIDNEIKLEEGCNQ